MRRFVLPVLSFGCLVAVATAAQAEFPYDWERIDTHVFTRDIADRETVFPLQRRYERIAFVARDVGVHCRYVRIEYGNGTSQRIEDQDYRQDRERRHDLAGDDRRISEVKFRCRSRQDQPARLIVYAQ